jgi:hypothetical protein
MADIDKKVLDAVEAALQSDPRASIDDLMEIGKTINPSVGNLSRRQFHARYPLQIKRRLAPPRAKKKTRAPRSRQTPTSTPDTAGRKAVRSAFLAFAAELAGAESRQDLVRVVAGVDRWVDEVLEGMA